MTAGTGSEVRGAWAMMDPARVVIVGGGFSGAAAAVQLLRRSLRPLQVTVVEPRAALGHGLAYSATDPDHRLNAPVERHAVDPDDPQAFARWIDAAGLRREDPGAWLPDGRCYPRRRDFGRFVAHTLAAHARMANGSGLAHHRDLAVQVQPQGPGWRVITAAGAELPADLLLLATGNPPPRLPGFVAPGLAARPGVVGNPLEPGALQAVPLDAQVLVLGSGLTALDVVSTLLQRGHRGALTVVSRHGLRPCPQPDAADLARLAVPHGPFDAPGGPLPEFIAALGLQPRLRPLLRALRARIRADAAAGLPWSCAFGALRDAVWRFWPAVPEADRRQFARHLRVWYDVHRFLSPPQNEALVRAAERAGRVRFVAARVQAVRPAAAGPALEVHWQPRGTSGAGVRAGFDALVNCTGIDGNGVAPANPLLRTLCDQGWLAPGPAGIGLAVDREMRALDRDGAARDTLRVVGPPSVGALGDPIGAGYIAMQLRRAMPSMLRALGSPLAPVRPEAASPAS